MLEAGLAESTILLAWPAAAGLANRPDCCANKALDEARPRGP